MKKEIPCTVVRDLLPNYVEQLTSEETNLLMNEHFSNCFECTNERDMMIKEIQTKKMPEIQNLKKYLNKTKRMYLLKGIILSIFIISVLVCFIVDIAVNHKLTWSIIVDASILFAGICGTIAITSKKHKIINTMIGISVLLLPMLFIFERVINKNYVSEFQNWFYKYALPISLIWLSIIWILLLLKYLAKMKVWNILGIFFLLIILGSLLTEAISRKTTIFNVYKNGFEWIESIIYFICAIFCFGVGHYRKNRMKF